MARRENLARNDAHDTLDAGDDVQVDDDFNSATLALTYDAAGNVTSDGVLGYVCDEYATAPDGEIGVLQGNSGSGETAALLPGSGVGNPHNGMENKCGWEPSP